MSDENTSLAMKKSSHPGELVRECMKTSGWTVTETARQVGVGRPAFSRLINGRAGISPEMALALERIGWSNADYWMRFQAAYDLAQARLRQAAA